MLGSPELAAADAAAKPAPPAANAPGQLKPAIVAAPTKTDPITQKAQALTTANTERNALIDKLSSVDPKDIDKVKKDLDAKDAQIKKLVTELVNLRKPRPRTPPDARPVGRGFVLA